MTKETNTNDIVEIVTTEKLVATKPVETAEKAPKVKREAKKYTLAEGEIAIPHKIACSKCGKMVSGLPKIIADRIKEKYGNSWERYTAEWQCSECANADKKAEKAKKDTEKKAKKIADAIKLVEANGYKVTK